MRWAFFAGRLKISDSYVPSSVLPNASLLAFVVDRAPEATFFDARTGFCFFCVCTSDYLPVFTCVCHDLSISRRSGANCTSELALLRLTVSACGAKRLRSPAASFEVELPANGFSDLFIIKLLQDSRRRETNGVETWVSKSLALERAEGDQSTSPASLVTYSLHRTRSALQAQRSLHRVMPTLGTLLGTRLRGGRSPPAS